MRAIRGFVCAALCLAAMGVTTAFEAGAREKIALDALRLAPPALARHLGRNRNSLTRGAGQAVPAGTADIAHALQKEMNAAVGLIDGRKPFKQISESLGRLAGMAASLNDPYWGSADESSAGDGAKFAKYFESRMARFPLVCYGYDSPALGEGGLEGYVSAVRDRYVKERGPLDRAYHPPSGVASPSDFDDRSVPFAIASLAYSHAVTDTAQLWIHIWRRAHGDLSGTPYLTAAAKETSP